LVTALAGPTAYALDTVATAHTGAIPSAGPSGQSSFGGPGGRSPMIAGRANGGLLDTSQPDSALVSALEANASDYRWVAATVGSNNAAGLQLASNRPVMSIGGFNGTDPTPTLAEFQKLVAAGEVHYFIAGGGMGFGGPGGGSSSNTSSAITAWVEANYSATTIGGVTVYDLG
jgi:hypothetical protein